MIASTIPNTNKLKEILRQANIKVLALAKDTSNLASLINKHEPTLILLDVAHVKDEKKIVESIIVEYNVPVIILSTRSVHDTAKTVYAISHGASDFILCDQINIDYYQTEVVKKVKNLVSNTQKKVKKGLQVEKKQSNAEPQKRLKEEAVKQNKVKPYKLYQDEKRFVSTSDSFHQIVAIGTSTGGPKALQAVLSEFPKDFPAPIMIVQHMPSGFTKSLAKRLNHICKINVKEAVDGEVIQAGTAYIAPGNYHLIVDEKLKTSVFKERERDGHRPSVNVLFESIAKLTKLEKIAVILTGMGKDGAAGVSEMKDKDPNTVVIVEAEETAIIYGMPRATIKTGAVTEVIPLEDIGETIIHYILKRGN